MEKMIKQNLNMRTKVQQWIEFIRGSLKQVSIDNLKENSRTPMPFFDNNLKDSFATYNLVFTKYKLMSSNEKFT